jgi:hypothetical protein
VHIVSIDHRFVHSHIFTSVDLFAAHCAKNCGASKLSTVVDNKALQLLQEILRDILVVGILWI